MYLSKSVPSSKTLSAEGLYNLVQVEAIRGVFEAMVTACETLSLVNDSEEEDRSAIYEESFAHIQQAKRLAMFDLYNTPAPALFDMVMQELSGYYESCKDNVYYINDALQIVYKGLLEDNTIAQSIVYAFE